MAELQDELFSIIGSTLKDEYGHEIGRVISITTTPSSRVKEVLVSSKGEFLSYPRERIKINENGEPDLDDLREALDDILHNEYFLELLKIYKSKQKIPD